MFIFVQREDHPLFSSSIIHGPGSLLYLLYEEQNVLSSNFILSMYKISAFNLENEEQNVRSLRFLRVADTKKYIKPKFLLKPKV